MQNNISPAVNDQNCSNCMVIKACNFHILLICLWGIFPDIGPSQVKLWDRELRMSEICQHGNEAES